MSKATWDEDVKFDDEENDNLSLDGMVENPQISEPTKEEEYKYDVAEKDQEKEEQDDGESEEVLKIKHKLLAYEKLRRQNYAQLDQMRKLQAERDHFQLKALEQYETNLKHSEDILNQKLQLAKSKLEIAIEEGNTKAIADSNAEVAAVTTEIQEVSKQRKEWQFSKQTEEQKFQENEFYARKTQDQNLNWFYSNPEFNPHNPNYDKKLQRNFINFAKEIDNELISQGKASVIGTQEYYDYFENVMDNYRANRQESDNKSAGNVRYNPVAPISRGNTRGAGSNISRKSSTLHISPEEARINKLWGITPKEHVEFSRDWKDKDFEMEY